ncbi:uncharacterized protein LOC124383083 isoform X2 [Silurus meridionalis]|uniref:uncharacterized protein LOC124383083 isoform X2 n=1 Tax=Silurus meridionalis TaxID=175797 RepID=UPI001EEC74C2|nr:uncharacterized protein LOC124383083 isoform X2 [Silurus meridionalis]
MLYLAVIGFLFFYADYINSYETYFPQQMNRTAVRGETVVFHCNGTMITEHIDTGWRKDGDIIFIYSPIVSRLVINYTSSRMQVDSQNSKILRISNVQLSDAGLYSCFPLKLQWKLTIEENLKEMLFFKVFPVTLVCVAVGLFIFCMVFSHRNWKMNGGSNPTETRYELVYTMTSPNNFAVGHNFES